MDMTTADPLVGTTLDQRYRVEARVASGGMATVYVAHDLRLDRRLACKVMHPSLAEDPTFVRRFINEAHSVAKLSHPNVVGVFDQGTDQGHVYLCMEYVPGRTLRDMLHARGRLAPRDALDIIAPVLAALGAAHQAGMIHRDVKPENVLLTESGLVKVADFGLARAVESQQGMTKTGTLMGTAAYLAPEQIERGTSDARTDVYAAGIMLYEMLTGRQPHTGDTPISIAYQHVNEDVPRPSRMVPGIPPEVDTLVTRATERDPRYRPANAGQYLALVLEARNSLPAAAGAGPVPGAAAPAPVNANDTLVVEAGGLADLRDPDDLDDDLPPERRGPLGRLDRRHYPALLVSAVLALVLIVLGWWFFIGRYEPVPDVVGMGEEEAANVLRDAGLRMEVADSQVYSDDVEPGLIAEVDPGVDDRVLPNDTVTVSLSKGPQTVEMPDVVGQSASDARAALEEEGFTEITEEQTTSHEEPAGTVLSTDPEPGAEADREGEIVLTVAQGFDLPDVVGQDQEQARSTLEDLGLQVSLTEQSSDDVPAGQVISQDPQGGSTASAGDDVTLTVSTGPEMVAIPDVTGWKVQDAEKELRELGFEVTVTEILGGDRVVRYSPEGEAEKGTEIELWVSPFGPGGDEGEGGGNGNNGNGNGNGRGGDD
ncbi:Stk1 family PASTA domain-containing Ser/Thr kinase [Streptomonospora sp. S1-112]|uniref:non-specific serine/threonine protein kinase n=1 Tax=Streptomonospora mangrovi TaxID=2883123 RepID=A0A9X3NLC0_9ACTN|nr:Stk1 family PASTA domain-containing Ser/Thr kinase [Streptomonospora mangrovi]MDA0565418.1 Stk1 family PASTA domain-containing Ser/Thr kinase [Streptomonospora mangrovi]